MESTTPTGLQQTGAQAVSTGNPQEIAQSSLQPQATSNLQPSSTQTVDSINALDQGSTAINLSTITNTTGTTVPQTAEPRSHTQLYVYGAVTIICAAILAYMTYNLLKPRS